VNMRTLKARLHQNLETKTAGFTLVEAIVSIGILSLIITSLAFWLSDLSLQTASTLGDFDVDEGFQNVQAAFGDDDRYCAAILKGLPLDFANPQGTAFNQVAYHSLDGTETTKAVVLNQPVSAGSSVTVDDMRIVPDTLVGAGAGIVNLNIRFLKSRFVGSRTFLRKIPVYVSLNAGIVDKCSLNPMHSYAINIHRCDVNGEGLLVYDPSTGGCIDAPNVIWVTGSGNQQATCPTGFRLAAPKNLTDYNPWSYCWSTAQPTVSIPDRSYGNGAVITDPGNNFVPHVSVATATCTFAYSVGFDATGVTTYVRCVPN
jgi:hypothetical protein